MNPISEQQKKSVRNVRLTALERGAIRDTLLAEMAAHPIANVAGVRNAEAGRHQVRREQLTTIISRKHMTIALLIALFMSGSVSYAAEGSLPGDVLYPVKIHVNENIESALAVRADAEARLSGEIALRRLAEAAQLRAESRLDQETKKELRAQFNAHTSDMEASLRSLGDSDTSEAAEISSEFEARLMGHVDTLSILGVQVGARASSTVEGDETGTIAPRATPKNGVRIGGLLEAVFEHNDEARSESSRSIEGGVEGKATATESSALDREDERGVIDVDTNVRLNTNTDIEIAEDKSRLDLNGNIKTEGGLKIGL